MSSSSLSHSQMLPQFLPLPRGRERSRFLDAGMESSCEKHTALKVMQEVSQFHHSQTAPLPACSAVAPMQEGKIDRERHAFLAIVHASFAGRSPLPLQGRHKAMIFSNRKKNWDWEEGGQPSKAEVPPGWKGAQREAKCRRPPGWEPGHACLPCKGNVKQPTACSPFSPKMPLSMSCLHLVHLQG